MAETLVLPKNPVETSQFRTNDSDQTEIQNTLAVTHAFLSAHVAATAAAHLTAAVKGVSHDEGNKKATTPPHANNPFDPNKVGGSQRKINEDLWPELQWLLNNDQNPGDGEFDFDLSVSDKLVDWLNPNNGVLQRLLKMMESFKNHSNDPILMLSLIQFITNIANSPIADNPDVQAWFKNNMPSGSLFPDQPSAENMEQALADMIVLWSYGKNGGDHAKTIAFIQGLLSHMQGLQDSPIAGDLYNRLVGDERSLDALDAMYLYNNKAHPEDKGRLYYTLDGKPPADDLSNVVFCDEKDSVTGTFDQWDKYIGGMMGKYEQNCGASQDSVSFGSATDSLFAMMMDDFVKKIKNPMLLLIILMAMMGTTKDSDYQIDLSGLASSTGWSSAEVQKDLNALLADVNNPDYFTGPDANAHAKDFMDKIRQLKIDIANNPNASSLAGNVQTFMDAIFNLKDGPESTVSLLDDYKSGHFDRIATALAAYTKDLSSGPGSQIVNNINIAVKSFTDRSQALTTETQKVSGWDQTITNYLKGFLTDSTSGVVALENYAQSKQTGS